MPATVCEKPLTVPETLDLVGPCPDRRRRHRPLSADSRAGLTAEDGDPEVGSAPPAGEEQRARTRAALSSHEETP